MFTFALLCHAAYVACLLMSLVACCCCMCTGGMLVTVAVSYAGSSSTAATSAWLLFGLVCGLELLRCLCMALVARAFREENLA